MIKKPLTILSIIILTSAGYTADNKISVKTDWIKGVIISEGKSSLSIDDDGSAIDSDSGSKTSISYSRNRAYEAAKEKASHEAAMLINEIYIDNSTRIKDLVINDPVIRQNIAHYIHEYAKFKEQPSGYLSTGCTIELKLSYLLNAINITYPQDPFPLRDDIEISTKYTSLIIDTRGFGIKPVLLPSVMNESGLEVYSRNYISPHDAVRHLAVSYTYNEKDAVKHKKAGKRPFFCHTLKSLNGNPVISDDDIKRIFSHKENLTYLKKCRVIFIIDR